MTAEQFLDWTLDLPDDTKYELLDGRPVAMAPQTYAHATIKSRIVLACLDAAQTCNPVCRVVSGMGIRVSSRSVFIPDALMQCGPPIADDARLLDDPLAVVEIVAPATRHIDTGRRFFGYFGIDTLRHFLIVDVAERLILHHSRDGAGHITSRVHTEADPIHLDPPGIVLEGAFPPPA